MENASKALLMAASVLMGVMIISIAVVLSNSFGGFGKDIITQIEETKVAEFNAQFLKYYGAIFNEKTGNTETIKLTAHDVVTLTNLAKKNNIEYDVQDESEKNENSYYVQIALESDVNNFKKVNNLENKTDDELTFFLQQNVESYSTEDESVIKYYYIDSVEISQISGRVIYVVIKNFK